MKYTVFNMINLDNFADAYFDFVKKNTKKKINLISFD